MKNTHSDNGMFAADVLQADCADKYWSQNFLGGGTHHQNAHAEQVIR